MAVLTDLLWLYLLWLYYLLRPTYYDLAAQDPTSSGEVSEGVLVAGLREVVQAALPWDSFVHDLANVDAAGRVRYQTFLARYRVESSDTAWQGRVLASLYAKLCEKDLSGTLAFFDTNLDGQVTTVELTQASSRSARSRPLALPAPPRPYPPLMATGPPLTAPSPPLTASTRVAWQVLQKCGFGLSTEQSEGFASQLLQGQASVKTTQLLDNFQVKFKESSESEQGPRPTPAWAKALLDTARCPPQLPPPCHHRPVPISSGPQQRGSTPQHPDTQAHVRARVHTVSCRSASTAPRSPCPPAGEQAVRRAEVELTRPLPLLRQER